ncbi:MAG: hypothetical protein Q9157_005433 [Trypethelium eluteriae]
MPPKIPATKRRALASIAANSLTTATSTSSTSAKRTATDAGFDSNSKSHESGIGMKPNDASIVEVSSDDDEEEDDYDSDDELVGLFIDKNCDQIRRMINTFIEAGGMKVGEFQKALRVSSNAYSRFMSQSGKDKGAGCATYHEAWRFFKKREIKGIPMPKKRKVTATKSAPAGTQKGGVASSGAAPVSTTTSKSASASASASAPQSKTIYDIHLPGEESDTAPIFDSCDEIRRKIGAHMRKDGVTAAGFCRELRNMYNTDRRPKQIQSKQLYDFRGKKGPLSGNTSCVSYGAYVFFEKMRLLEGKPEGKHRIECVSENPEGIDTTRQHK